MGKIRIDIRNRIVTWLSARMEECRTVSPLFSFAMDRRLTLVERVRVRLHLLTCGACLNYVSNLAFMRDALRARDAKFDKATAAGAPGEKLSDVARNRIRAAVRERA